MTNKKINSLGIIIDLKQISNSPKYINYFEELEKYQGDKLNGYVIDMSNIFSFKKNSIEFKYQTIKSNQFFYKPENIFELYKISRKINCIAIFHLPNQINFLLKQLILKIFGFKRFSVASLGMIYDNTIPKQNNFKNKYYYFVNMRLGYYSFRILQSLGLYKSIDFFFDSSQKLLDEINNSISYKINKKISWLNFSFYKRKFRINSIPYSKFLNKNYKISNNYIVLADSGFDHQDRILREGNPSEKDREEYYFKLNNFLENLSKLLNKEVIICLHPKVNYIDCKSFLQLKSKFKTFLRRTEEFIYQADTVIFFESSTIINAIILRKKIINLNTNLMGKYYFKRNNLYKNLINIYQLNLDNYNLPSSEDLNKILEEKKNNYENYINENIVSEEGIDLYSQVNKILLKEYFKDY